MGDLVYNYGLNNADIEEIKGARSQKYTHEELVKWINEQLQKAFDEGYTVALKDIKYTIDYIER